MSSPFRIKKTHSNFHGFPRSQSPSVLKVKRLVSEAQPRSQLSGFNLITWNQKTKYKPPENLRRLKAENDVIMHQIANQKLREKTIHRGFFEINNKQQDQAKLSYYQHLGRIRQGTETRFLTEQQEELLMVSNTPLSQETFRIKHSRLWSLFANNNQAITSATKASPQQRSATQPLKSHLDPPKQPIFKTRSQKVNQRMETILMNWNKKKNSINERYYELWVKPFARKKQEPISIPRWKTTGVKQQEGQGVDISEFPIGEGDRYL